MSLRVKKEDLSEPETFIAKAKVAGMTFVTDDGERFFLVQFGDNYPEDCVSLTEYDLRREFARRSDPAFNYL